MALRTRRELCVRLIAGEICMSKFKTGVIVALCAAVALSASTRLPQAPASITSTHDPKLIEDLVYANRILYDQGVVDAFGHVSARDDKDPNRFLLARSVAPALVTSSDILEFDSNGEPIDARGRTVYLERFIHAAIYRARPDVKAIVHSHSPAVIPFGVTGTILRPIDQMSAFLGAGAPIFEIRDAAGMTNLLITDNKLGDALARALGDKAVVLMRGHGSVAVGDSILQVVHRAIYTEANARLQAEAARLGPINFLTPEEAAKADAVTDSKASISRPWELWKARIGKID
jgi:ribulose-5-phosphate 4-epimerase/fuculose-1-phosphate aldolase